MKKIKFAPVAIAVVLLLAACNPNPHKKFKITDPNTGEKTEVEVTKGVLSNNVTIENKENGGTLNITEGKMPEGMPSYFTPYPNGKTIKSMHALNPKEQSESKKGEAMIVSFETKDAPQKIIDFYKPTLLKNGFSEEGSINMGKMVMVNFVNKEQKLATQIMATNDNADVTMAQIIVEKGN